MLGFAPEIAQPFVEWMRLDAGYVGANVDHFSTSRPSPVLRRSHQRFSHTGAPHVPGNDQADNLDAFARLEEHPSFGSNPTGEVRGEFSDGDEVRARREEFVEPGRDVSGRRRITKLRG